MTRLLIIRLNEQGLGFDVGWRVPDTHDGEGYESWWGNTRDATSLRSLIRDIRSGLPSIEFVAPPEELIERLEWERVGDRRRRGWPDRWPTWEEIGRERKDTPKS